MASKLGAQTRPHTCSNCGGRDLLKLIQELCSRSGSLLTAPACYIDFAASSHNSNFVQTLPCALRVCSCPLRDVTDAQLEEQIQVLLCGRDLASTSLKQAGQWGRTSSAGIHPTYPTFAADPLCPPSVTGEVRADLEKHFSLSLELSLLT